MLRVGERSHNHSLLRFHAPNLSVTGTRIEDKGRVANAILALELWKGTDLEDDDIEHWILSPD